LPFPVSKPVCSGRGTVALANAPLFIFSALTHVTGIAPKAGFVRRKAAAARDAGAEKILFHYDLLVTGGVAFYNPFNTALEAVVSLTRHLGPEPPTRTVRLSAS